MSVNVSGVSIQDILNVYSPEDISKLNEKDLRAITNRLVSAANKRIRRAKKSGRSGYVYASLDYAGGSFSIKNKSFNQTRAEFTRVYNFLKNPTSTAAGYKQAITEAESRFKELTGIEPSDMTKSEIKKYFEHIARFREQYPNKNLKYDAKALAQMVVEGKSEKDIDEAMRNSMRENYEQMLEEDITINAPDEFDFYSL